MPGNSSRRPTTFCDVLIVEDNVALNDMLAAFLGRNGLDVRTAVSAAAALRMLEMIEPRVGVFDYELPDRTGLALAQEIRQQLPEMPIILMSGSVSSVERSDMTETGIIVFVNKPVPPSALLRAIRQLLNRRR